jgi:aspartate ammonia-lyase
VIPEAAAQIAMLVMGHDQTIAQACAAGSLELNPFLPLVADCLLHSIDLLARGGATLRRFCVAGLTADETRCRTLVEQAHVSLAALVPQLGYHVAQELGAAARTTGRTVRQIVLERGLMTAAAYDEAISAEAVLRLGTPPGAQSGESP